MVKDAMVGVLAGSAMLCRVIVGKIKCIPPTSITTKLSPARFSSGNREAHSCIDKRQAIATLSSTLGH